MQNSDNVIPFPTGGRDRPGMGHEPEAGVPDLDALLDFGFGGPDNRPRPVLFDVQGQARRCFVVRLDLDGAQPPIWRRLRLASDITLDRLHDIIQISMGWHDCHLHHFQMGPNARDFQMIAFRTPFEEDYEAVEVDFEEDVRLDQVIARPRHRLYYTYDFGDSWQHTLKLEKVEPWADGDPDAVCVSGQRACPPEDVGGIYGYEEVLEALAGRVPPVAEEWMAEKLSWMPPDFDPAHFDVDRVNEALAVGEFPSLAGWNDAIGQLLAEDRSGGATGLPELVRAALADHDGDEALDDATVEEATRRYRLLVRTIGSGVKLTTAGYLPPSVVDGLLVELKPQWPPKPGRRESDTRPVFSLRLSATSLGLLRKANGRLSVTRLGAKLAEEPRALLDHIRSRVPLGRGFEPVAGALGLLCAAAGQDAWSFRGPAADIALGLGWDCDGDMSVAVGYASAPTLDILDQLCGRPAPVETRSRMARFLLGKAADRPSQLPE